MEALYEHEGGGCDGIVGPRIAGISVRSSACRSQAKISEHNGSSYVSEIIIQRARRIVGMRFDPKPRIAVCDSNLIGIRRTIQSVSIGKIEGDAAEVGEKRVFSTSR